ncbi:coiled-coil domain-containing protein [Wolbachia endosymbiont (group B) of Apotomis betuletana]|uniref:hypothetical protein n=2 Tax=unclassified Wolbachia TaxID=2640676 RepID=UPI0022276414|nr:hypothetical protein [Wolbachia endosymbiont (group B) of Apotomis betuletana]
MLNANNKVNYEPSIKQKEKKYSLSTVLAWLYLKTIGRILPGRWNKWAENILHHNKVIVNNGVQTDAPEVVDQSVQISEVVAQEVQSKIISEGKTTFKDTEIQTEFVETEDKNEKLKEQLEGVSQALEVFIELCNNQAEYIENLQLESDFLKEEKEQLNSLIKKLKESYKELAKVARKRGEEFLVQLKKKSEEILRLQKELTERSKEFANKIEMLSVRVEEKDGEIGRLTQLNEVLEQEKKEMETKNNEQKQVISDLEKRIKEQEDLIKSFHENKDINETVKKENENLRVQKTELENEVSKLKNEFDTKIKQLNEQKKAELEQAKKKDAEFRKKLESAQQQLEQEKTNLNTIEKKKQDLESEINELKEQAKGKDAEVENLKQQLEKDKSDSISKLNATETEKKELESKITSLQEQVQALEKSKEWESAGIDDSLKETHSNLTEMLKEELAKQEKQIKQLQEEHKQAENRSKIDITKLQEENKGLLAEIDQLKRSLSSTPKQLEQQQLSNNQEQQKLQNKQKDASKKPEDINKKTKADTKSIFSTSGSVKSKFSNTLSKLRGNDSLDKFLSDQNTKLKKSFPEFEGKHFCHNVLDETIKSLSNQGDGKLESDKLLELLKSNLMKSGRAIIEIKVNTVVEKVGKKHSIEQVIFVQECAKGLYLNEEDSQAIISSLMEFLAHKNNSNNDSVKKFVVQKLTEAEMKCFSDKIQGLQLASSIRDKFLSPDQKMCVQTSKENNEYELTDKAKKEGMFKKVCQTEK